MTAHPAAEFPEPECSTAERLAYSPAEFATATGMARATVHNLITRGEIRSIKLGRRRLILASELTRIAAEQDAATAGDAA